MTNLKELREWHLYSLTIPSGLFLSVLLFAVKGAWLATAVLAFMLAGYVLDDVPQREGRLGDLARKMKTQVVGQAMFATWMLAILVGGILKLLGSTGVL
jgi:hypothetical protein